MRGQIVRYAIPGGALALVAAAVLWSRPSEFGWFAYAPQGAPTVSFSSGVVFMDAVHIALALAALGIGLLAGAVGYAFGRRASSRHNP